MRNKSASLIPTRSSGGARGGQASKLFFALALIIVFAFVSCSEDRVTSSYQTHPTNWMDEYSPDWHGQAALPSKGQACLNCHTTLQIRQEENDNYSNSSIGSCYDCHGYPHQADVAISHADVFSFPGSWASITNCQSCHGTNFAGGRTGASCNECHTQPNGPAACNTCHGMPPSTTNPLGNGNPGAHSAHSRYACTECHSGVNGLDHIDALPADVAFDDARISTSHGYPATYTNPSNCATYCHSNLHLGNPIVPVSWNTGQTFTQCRSCHAVPPTTEFHPTDNRCHLCHPNIDPSSNYNDANEIFFVAGDTLHVNGVTNAIFVE